MNRKPLITDIPTINKLNEILEKNPGLVIIKFGAEWCGPCKKIEKLVHSCIDYMPETVQSVIIDIDNNFELYAYFKNKKRLNGIPAILCWNKDNVSLIPDDSVVSSDETQVKMFFQRCYDKVKP
jgi:thiol:disulfide interchange protein